MGAQTGFWKVGGHDLPPTPLSPVEITSLYVLYVLYVFRLCVCVYFYLNNAQIKSLHFNITQYLQYIGTWQAKGASLQQCLLACDSDVCLGVTKLLKESISTLFLTISPHPHIHCYMQWIRWSRKYCCLDICPGADREGIVLGLSQASELIVVHGSCKVCFVMCLRIGVQDLAFSWNTRQIRSAHVPGGARGRRFSVQFFSIIYLFWFPCFVFLLSRAWFSRPDPETALQCMRGPRGFLRSYCSHYPKHSI